MDLILAQTKLHAALSFEVVWLGEDHNEGNFEEHDTERVVYTDMVVNSYESVDCGDGGDVLVWR